MKKLILNASNINNSQYFIANGVLQEYHYASLPGVFPLYNVGTKWVTPTETVDMYAPDVMDAVREMVKPGEYDQIVFAFNPADYNDSTSKTGGYTYGEDVYLGTQLCVIRLDGHEALYEQHETMHMSTHKVQRLGYMCNDDMDVTFVNGSPEYYYHNEDPSFWDGNYHRTWNNLKPYLKVLEEKVPIIKRSTKKNPWAFALQLQLLSFRYKIGIADGYFGPKTEAVIRQIQKENNLVVDGIFGPKTSACLKKKV
jgi:peptidoglycan hydrolase-like protein with peptidoglycan-binding domain